jgi:alcohol dehydrogenase class IV
MRTYWKYSIARDVLFGANTAQHVGEELTLRNITRAFITTDKHLVGAGVIDKIGASLTQANIQFAVFDGGAPEPSTDIVEAAATAARAFAPQAIIGIGGGSNMDVGKVIAALLANGGSVFDYFGENKVPGPALPIIAMPTTAGTGSETTPIAVLEDVRRHLKLAISSNHIMPTLAIVDPVLTVSCPPKVSAESGMDALTHAIESYTVLDFHALPYPPERRVAFTGKNPLTESLSARAIQLIGQHLRNAVYQPNNLAAREGMSLAALTAGMAFSSAGLASVHALQYPVGALTHTGHGLGNAILLPAVMEYLLPSNPAAFAQIAAWLGEDTSRMSQLDAARASVSAVQRLKADVGIPRGLSEIGVKEGDIEGMAQTAATFARLVNCSPRPATPEALAWMLRKAL